jgi:hypothetical protein
MASVKEWAERGAAQRAEEIRSELETIRKAFPDIGSRRRVQSGGGGGLLVPDEGKKKRRTRKPMTAAQKRAVGAWMRAYWARRRREKES